MRKIYLHYVLILLFLLNILLITSIYKNKHGNNLAFNELQATINLQEENYSKLMNRMLIAHEFENNEFYFYSDLNIDKFSLILRYPNLSCSTCMDSLFVLLSNNFSTKDIKNITIIANQSHEQYLNQLKRVYKQSLPNILQIDKESMVLPIDKLEIPYFFVVKDNKCLNIFITNKDKSGDTMEYIDIIKKKYFNRNSALPI